MKCVGKYWVLCLLFGEQHRAVELMAREPKMALGKISFACNAHCCPNFCYFLLPDQRLHTVPHNICIHTHISADEENKRSQLN